MEFPAYFTTYEKNIIQDRDFFKAKFSIIDKVHQFFDAFQEEMRSDLAKRRYAPPLPCDISTGKISRGENYENMPWLISDYPRIFSREKVFAFRLMFWWGHHFSFNFHIQGNILENYREHIAGNLNMLSSDHTYYFCAGNSPWDYDFEGNNFIPLTASSIDKISMLAREKDFIKISRKMPLCSSFEELRQEGFQTFDELMKWTGHTK